MSSYGFVALAKMNFSKHFVAFFFNEGVADHIMEKYRSAESFKVQVSMGNFCFLNESDIEFHHYAGITHNFNLCRNNTLQYLHNPLIFLDYLNESLKCGVLLDNSYKNECVEYIELIKSYYL